jgi:large subunit ribosomal protein L25
MVEVNDTIQAKGRKTGGKAAAHKLRKEGLIPVVAYGPGREPLHLAVEPKQFTLQRQAFGTSHIYDVAIDDGTRFKALIKDLTRDVITREVLHVDLYAVDMTKPIRVAVPIELVGKAAGIVEGGILSQVMREVEVLCLPDRVPAKLSVDISHLKVNDSLHLSEVPLSEGVKLTTTRDETVAIVAAPEAEEAPAPAAVEGAVEGEVPAEGAEAAAPPGGEKAEKTEGEDKGQKPEAKTEAKSEAKTEKPERGKGGRGK